MHVHFVDQTGESDVLQKHQSNFEQFNFGGKDKTSSAIAIHTKAM